MRSFIILSLLLLPLKSFSMVASDQAATENNYWELYKNLIELEYQLQLQNSQKWDQVWPEDTYNPTHTSIHNDKVMEKYKKPEQEKRAKIEAAKAYLQTFPPETKTPSTELLEKIKAEIEALEKFHFSQQVEFFGYHPNRDYSNRPIGLKELGESAFKIVM